MEAQSTIQKRLEELSEKGDFLEKINQLVDFEIFRQDLERAVPRKSREKGGRPAFNHILMFKILLLQTYHNLSDERIEFLLKDRLTFMRFLGLGLGDRVPDANTIWLFREALTKAGAIESLFRRFDESLRKAGYLAMGGQIVDASVVLAPKQRMTREEKEIVKAGGIPEDWKAHPSKLAQKDREARWMVRQGRKPQKEEKASKGVMIAVPYFGYKNHLSTDRWHGLIRRWMVSDAASYDGDKLPHLLDKENTASSVWADTAYRSKKNQSYLEQNGFSSKIHFKRQKGKPLSRRHAEANTVRSKVRSRIEHVFGYQKNGMSLFIRSIGIARAKTKIGLVNLAYNIRRFLWLEGRSLPS
jgi:IS5 family transposase